MSPFTRETAALYGRKGGLRGGPARAKSATKEDRIRIARKGGKARQAKARKP